MRDIQQQALDDVLSEFINCMSAAERDQDPWQAIRIMVRCEKILDSYIAAGFNELAEYQRELQADLRKIWRMARRRFIKRALLSPAHEFELYLADMRDPALHLDDADSLDDFHAVERHLDDDQPLFADLRKRN